MFTITSAKNKLDIFFTYYLLFLLPIVRHKNSICLFIFFNFSGSFSRGIKPHMCVHCGKCFAKRENMYTHVSAVHQKVSKSVQ